MPSLNHDTLAKAFTYESYVEKVKALFAEGKSTAPEQTEELTHFSGLNIQRMKRWDKTTRIHPALRELIEGIREPQYWLLLTEGWCGDAAQIVPVINKMASLNPLIKLRLLLRDEHPEVMDAYLTNGARSIPKLVILRADDMKELATWGPRPAPVQKMVMDNKHHPTPLSKEELHKGMHLWYAKDKAKTIQQEFQEMLSKILPLQV